MLENFDIAVSYAPVNAICSLRIIIEIASVEGLIIFVLDIYNSFQKNMLPNNAEIFYLSLPYPYQG